MAGNYKIGATLAVDGEKEFKKAISGANQELRVLASEAKLAAVQFKDNADSLTAVTTKYNLAKEATQVQAEKVRALKEALDGLEKSEERNEKKINDYKIQLANAERQLIQYTEAEDEAAKAVEALNKPTETAKKITEKLKDAYSSARESVEQLKEEHPKLTSAIEKANGAAEKLAKAGLNGLAAAGKAAGAALGAAATATGAIVKSSVEAYAETEQLVGGMQKLYGEDAQKMISQANDAYMTAGMNASEYMQTATEFSASLISGLGGDTAKAADYADKAIRQMSDNANTFGTDIGTIQNAYKGFAKENFTMLDNLSLGYSGTKQGMIDLINDSGLLNEKISSLDGISFDQMVDAIGLVQDKMQITGATAAEANMTIEGSVNSAKSAYQNLIAGLGNEDANVSQLVNNLIDSGFNAFKNITNRIQEILPSLAEAITMLGSKIPEIFTLVSNDILPQLTGTALSLIESLGTAFINSAPSLIPAAVGIITSLVTFLSQNANKMITGAATLITTLIDSFTKGNNLQTLIHGCIDTVGAIVNALIDNAPALIKAAWEMAKALVDALINYDWSKLAKSIFNSIKDSIIGFFSGNDENESHAGGISRVPYNGYIAELHENERVLSAAEAQAYNNGSSVDYEQLNAKVDMLLASQRNEQPININVSGSAGAIVRSLNVEIEKEGKRRSAFA